MPPPSPGRRSWRRRRHRRIPPATDYGHPRAPRSSRCSHETGATGGDGVPTATAWSRSDRRRERTPFDGASEAPASELAPGQAVVMLPRSRRAPARAARSAIPQLSWQAPQPAPIVLVSGPEEVCAERARSRGCGLPAAPRTPIARGGVRRARRRLRARARCWASPRRRCSASRGWSRVSGVEKCSGCLPGRGGLLPVRPAGRRHRGAAPHRRQRSR